eukprot:4014524-Prymnesium_polylepis.1
MRADPAGVMTRVLMCRPSCEMKKSREYARGVDPLKMPRAVREAALNGLGWAMDDNAAYPRARIAMVP